MNNKLLAEKIYLYDLMTRVSPAGILSYVSDSYDFWGIVTQVVPSLRETIMARDGKVVIRPDSGDPVKILTGYTLDEYELGGHGEALCKETGDVLEIYELKGLVQYLYEVFGGTETETGHKLLDEHIGCIYGDSITLERQEEILSRLADKGFASGNVVLGIGSFTYQYVTRDTHGSAIKATNITTTDGESIAIAKDPKTGDGSKKSAKGLLMVTQSASDEFILSDQVSEEQEQSAANLLELVWRDGNWHRQQTLEGIRAIVASN